MDTIDFGICLQALWAMPAMLAVIDMDEMLRVARKWGSDRDVELILALRMIKEERHAP
jgi:hypothetical protein